MLTPRGGVPAPATARLRRRGENAERSRRLRAHAGSGDEGERRFLPDQKAVGAPRCTATVPALYPAHLSSLGGGTYGSAAPPRSDSELRPGPAPGCGAYASRLPSGRGACVLVPGGGVSTHDPLRRPSSGLKLREAWLLGLPPTLLSPLWLTLTLSD